MSDLEPITREETAWANGDLEPITRKEKYIKHLYDETQEIPDPPQTREEWFIKKAGEEIHDVTIEPLTATDNGTYSESGKAYSPVTVAVPLGTKSITANGTYNATDDSLKGYSSVSVDVPLPDNGCLKKDLPTGSIATVTDAEAEVMPSLKIAITPVQSGSGDPSPDNIRPISGWTGCNVFENGVNFMEVSNDNLLVSTGTAKIENGKIISTTNYICRAGLILRVKSGYRYRFRMTRGFGGTSYGYLRAYSVKPTNYNGIEIAEEAFSSNKSWVVTYTVPEGINWVYLFMYKSSGAQRFEISEMSARIDNTSIYEPYTGTTYPITFPSEAGTVYGGTLDVVNGTLTVTKANIASYDGETLPGAWISDRDVYAEGTTPTTGAQVVYELATPITYQLSPTAIKTLLNTNNIFADTGDILDGEYWSKNPVTVTQAMLNTLRSAGEITPTEEPEEPEENDER